jgi:hypothetical protein
MLMTTSNITAIPSEGIGQNSKKGWMVTEPSKIKIRHRSHRCFI